MDPLIHQKMVLGVNGNLGEEIYPGKIFDDAVLTDACFEFAERFGPNAPNGPDPLFQEILQAETKEEYYTPQAKLSYRYKEEKGRHNGQGQKQDERLVSETRHAFILEDLATKDCGILGFKILREESIERLKKVMSVRLLRPGDPMIMQIQGPTVYTPQSNRENFPGLRWPLVLVTMFGIWARESGFPSIFLVPSNLHPDTSLRRSYRESPRYTYDATAEKMGFARPAQRDPYVFNFFQPLPCPQELEQDEWKI